MRNPLATANGFGQAQGRGAAHADDDVSVVYAGHGFVDDARRHVDDGRVEDPGVEAGDEALDPAGERDSGRAGNDERRGHAESLQLGRQARERAGAVDYPG